MSINPIIFLLSCILSFRSISILDRMGEKTPHGIRAAWVLIAAASISVILSIFIVGRPTNWLIESLYISGITSLCFFERRSYK